MLLCFCNLNKLCRHRFEVLMIWDDFRASCIVSNASRLVRRNWLHVPNMKHLMMQTTSQPVVLARHPLKGSHRFFLESNTLWMQADPNFRMCRWSLFNEMWKVLWYGVRSEINQGKLKSFSVLANNYGSDK